MFSDVKRSLYASLDVGVDVFVVRRRRPSSAIFENLDFGVA